jgi:hypothetical protein
VFAVLDALRHFTFTFLAIVTELSQVRIDDPKYCETTAWYSYRRGRLQEGIIPKAIRLLDCVQLLEVTPLSAVAKVPSESSDKTYDVKVILRPDEPLIDFSCTCAWGEFRARPCKHVVATVFYPLKDILDVDESKVVRRDDYIVYSDWKTGLILTRVHEALNKSAYLRVKLGEAFS